MADDRKRSNPVTVRFTDRELLDASKQAVREDRTLAEYLHFIIRRSLYGSMGVLEPDGNAGASSVEHRKDE